jgi:hypothetical protein
MTARVPGHDDILTQEESRADETLPRAQRKAPLRFMNANNLTDRKETDADTPLAHGGPHTGSSSHTPQENPKVEDFDDSANALWSLYVKEAKSHDEATVGTIKDDMEGVLIFVRSYTSSLLRADCVNGPIRPACSLLPSPRSLSIVLRTYNRVPHNSPLYCLTRSPINFPLSEHRSLPICLSQDVLSVRHGLTSG